jgi:hypothetical protein
MAARAIGHFGGHSRTVISRQPCAPIKGTQRSRRVLPGLANIVANLDELEVGGHYRQKVVEVVRDATGELADGTALSLRTIRPHGASPHRPMPLNARATRATSELPWMSTRRENSPSRHRFAASTSC